MDRRTFLRTAPLAAVSGALPIAASLDAARAGPEADRGATPDAAFEIVARFDDPGPSGVAVTPGGRVFVSFPRHAIDHDRATLGLLRDGAIVPFPYAAMNALSDRPAAGRLVSVHGITTDALGRLWVVDDGKRAGRPIPDGGAKVVGFDPDTGEVIASVALKPPAMLPDKGNVARVRSLLAPAQAPTAAEPEPASDAGTAAPACPCCGGRLVIIERFRQGETPRARPTAIRIDTS